MCIVKIGRPSKFVYMVNKPIKPGPVGASQSTVLDLLRRYNLRPRRHRGQNFLIDESVYNDVLKDADLTPSDVVLEIGAGLGTLTERLSLLVRRVVAVELDSRLSAILRHRLILSFEAERQNMHVDDVIKSLLK